MAEFNDTDMKIIHATFAILQKEGFTKATTKKIAAEAEVNEVLFSGSFKIKIILLRLQRNTIFRYFLINWQIFLILKKMMKLKHIFKAISLGF